MWGMGAGLYPQTLHWFRGANDPMGVVRKQAFSKHTPSFLDDVMQSFQYILCLSIYTQFIT
jgi:hypothetical protein